MPDHLHAALRGNQAHSPNEIVDALQNNLAFALGQARIWEASFYAGTFSEYNMEAIRHTLPRPAPVDRTPIKIAAEAC